MKIRLGRLRSDLHAQRYALALGALALVFALGVPAYAVEGASTAANSVANALKIAKKADKRSKQALALAQQVSAKGGSVGPQGPAGAAGAAGAPGSAGPAGAAGSAGGDLTGPFSDLQLQANAVGATEIADDSAGVADIAAGGVGISELTSGGSFDITTSAMVSLATDECKRLTFSGAPRAAADVGELAIPQPAVDLGNGISVLPVVIANDDEIILNICNSGSATSIPNATTFHVRLVG